MELNWRFLFFRWKGRIGREWYWLGNLTIWIISASANFVFLRLAPQRLEYWAVAAIVTLIGLYSTVAVAIKRLHDRNKSAWWILLFYFLPNVIMAASIQMRPFLPMWWIGAALSMVISLWALIELGFRRGTQGSNHFGALAVDEPLPAWNPNETG
jgi:uncharacterized membrane protein YhaH (DUF805 family)